MEEETINTDSKKFDFKNFDYKKYLPFVAIAVAVIVVIILLVTLLGGGPKKAVKGFVSGMNKKDVSKIMKNIDVAGMAAWGYSYDVDDFSEDDYDEFLDKYKDIDKDELKDANKDMEDNLDDSLHDMSKDYKSYKVKVEKFKDVEKLGKDLYAVDAKISIVAEPKDKEETDEIDESETVTFVVYKNKLISLGGIGL